MDPWGSLELSLRARASGLACETSWVLVVCCFFSLMLTESWDATENRSSPLSRYIKKLLEHEEKNNLEI